MSDDIKEQVVQEIKSAGLFSIQLNESTDIQPCTQLLAFVRYVHKDLKEEFLFCEPLGLSTKDGAPAMLGSQSGFVTSYRKSTKYYPYSLYDPQASSGIKNYLQNYRTLNIFIKTDNFVKGSALITRLFKKLPGYGCTS
nr:protein ZBED8-like [Penaeus vannamei]